jgi:uncharacterized HAD superfamily protein
MRVQLIFDIDGVVCDGVSPVLKAIWEQFGVAIAPSAITEFQMHHALWPHVQHVLRSPEEFQRWMWRAVWSKLEGREAPIWETWSLLQEIVSKSKSGEMDKTVKLEYVTARPLYLEGSTAAWLARWGIAAPVSHCGRIPKADMYETRVAAALADEMDFIWIVEDKVEDAQRVAQLFRSNERVVVYVPDHPWTNNYWEHPDLRKRYLNQDLAALLDTSG